MPVLSNGSQTIYCQHDCSLLHGRRYQCAIFVQRSWSALFYLELAVERPGAGILTSDGTIDEFSQLTQRGILSRQRSSQSIVSWWVGSEGHGETCSPPQRLPSKSSSAVWAAGKRPGGHGTVLGHAACHVQHAAAIMRTKFILSVQLTQWYRSLSLWCVWPM